MNLKNRGIYVKKHSISSVKILTIFVLFLAIPPLIESSICTKAFTIVSKEKINTDPQIIWLVNESISAEAFPIAFQYVEGLNVTIDTSWGNTSEKTLESPDQAKSIYEWVFLPNSTKGAGNISVTLSNQLNKNYTVYWERLMQPSSPPITISFTSRKFSYWNGESILSSQILSNGSINIKHTLLEGHGPMEIDWFPYADNFTYSITLNSSVSSTLQECLIINDAINWQSWEYLPNAAYGDLGGWERSLEINWNNSYQTTCHQMVDNDSGLNTRILTTRRTAKFFGMLMTILNDSIEEKAKLTETTTSHLTPTTTNTTTSTIPGFSFLETIFIGMALITSRIRR